MTRRIVGDDGDALDETIFFFCTGAVERSDEFNSLVGSVIIDSDDREKRR